MSNQDAINGHQEGHGSLRSYIIGFILSLVLTAIAFGVVMSSEANSSLTFGVAIAVVVCAIIQLFVQIYFFLHLDGRKSQEWDIICALYCLIVIFLIVGGSLWIFYNLAIRTGLTGY